MRTTTVIAADLASLPAAPGLTIRLDGDDVIMDGGRFGAHYLTASVSSLARVAAHWIGYCANNGVELVAAKPAPIKVEKPRGMVGRHVVFPSASAAHGLRDGRVVKETATRVEIEFAYKRDRDFARRTGRPCFMSRKWVRKIDLK